MLLFFLLYSISCLKSPKSTPVAKIAAAINSHAIVNIMNTFLPVSLILCSHYATAYVPKMPLMMMTAQKKLAALDFKNAAKFKNHGTLPPIDVT